MDITPIASRAISALGYDPSRQILRVAFRSGTVYEYAGATPTLVKQLLHAESKGAFFVANIRDRLNYRRVK